MKRFVQSFLSYRVPNQLNAFQLQTNLDLIAPASFHKFEKLQTLKVQYEMISSGDTNAKMFDPRSDLPVSLEALHVNGRYAEGCWEHFTASLDGIAATSLKSSS